LKLHKPWFEESLCFLDDVEMAIKKLKDPNHQVFIKSWQYLLKPEEEKFAVRSVNLLILNQAKERPARCNK